MEKNFTAVTIEKWILNARASWQSFGFYQCNDFPAAPYRMQTDICDCTDHHMMCSRHHINEKRKLAKRLDSRYWIQQATRSLISQPTRKSPQSEAREFSRMGDDRMISVKRLASYFWQWTPCLAALLLGVCCSGKFDTHGFLSFRSPTKNWYCIIDNDPD